jgi:hypothetical protein
MKGVPFMLRTISPQLLRGAARSGKKEKRSPVHNRDTAFFRFIISDQQSSRDPVVNRQPVMVEYILNGFMYAIKLQTVQAGFFRCTVLSGEK